MAMGYKSITVDTSVNIDLIDIKYDVLELLESKDLIEELNKRDVIYEDQSEKYHMIPKDYISPDKLYRYLCDIVGCGYYEPKQSVLDKLKEMI